MGSGAMMYIQRFIMTGSGIQKLIGGGGFPDTHTKSTFAVSSGYSIEIVPEILRSNAF
jgi:hypothetical protein